MQQKPIIIFLVGVLIGGGTLFLIQTTNDDPYSMMDGAMRAGQEAGDPHAGHMMHDMMVTSERDFIEQMIPHHQEAIDTAQEVLERGGTTAEMRALAEDIIDAQREEIAQMRTWYADWYGGDVPEVEYTPMMRPLGELEGEALDVAFLEDMIMHHMGAIMMARSVEPYIEREEIAVLAEAVVRTQTAEVAAMRAMLEEF
jgi:uncharacterized protein (DUF305 family)